MAAQHVEIHAGAVVLHGNHVHLDLELSAANNDLPVPSKEAVYQAARDHRGPRLEIWTPRAFMSRIATKINQIHRELGLRVFVGNRPLYGWRGWWTQRAATMPGR